MARSNNVVSLARQANAQLLQALAAMRELKREIDSNGGGAWLDAAALEGHPGIDANDVTAVVYDTCGAIDGLLDASGGAHRGNLYRLL